MRTTMRTLRAVALFLCALAASLQPALGQEACAPDTGKLGVSRTIAIDTSQGPVFGGKYKGGGLLKDGEVVLTFDDGPSRPYHPPDSGGAGRTLHQGDLLHARPDGPRRPGAGQGGRAPRPHGGDPHLVARNLQRLSPEEGEAEIELGLSAVQQALGKPVAPFFRFPFLRDTPASLGYLRGRHLAAFALDIDSRDFETKDAAVVNERVMKRSRGKGQGHHPAARHPRRRRQRRCLPLLAS